MQPTTPEIEQSPETTTSILKDLADLYGKTLEPGTLAMYREALEEFTPKEVRRAVRPWIKTSKWFPKPSEIIANIYERRNEAYQKSTATQLTTAATQKPLRSHFRVTADRSIIEHVEHLRTQGKSLDEIAAEMCGPESPESEPRYRCAVCRDTRFVRVWHPEAMTAAYNREPVPRKTCTVLCSCESGRRLLEANPRMRVGYDDSRMVKADGLWHEDEARLSQWASEHFSSKRDPDLAQFSSAANGGDW